MAVLQNAELNVMIPKGTDQFSNAEKALQYLAGAAGQVGSPTFLETTLSALGKIVPADMAWAIVYSHAEPPHVLLHAAPRKTEEPLDTDYIRRLYDSGYYRFDPFFRHWRQTATTGVVRLSQILDSSPEDWSYKMGFIPNTGFAEDVALFCKLDDQRALAFTLERQSEFSADEIRGLELAFSLIQGMVESHNRCSTDLQAGLDMKGGDLSPLNFDAALKVFLADELTEREHEIVTLVLSGDSSGQIAEKLGVSVGTIKNHASAFTLNSILGAKETSSASFLAICRALSPLSSAQP
ncbi:LuxR family transcriptional regulator [Rhodobacteraceae bacterium RKSG542]|uniref:response regulator transcription factor n=1 Tax=Pseudovibrio flavus TaxID=2529854 RepID=UPI0012BD1D3B|nr:helix-turn-helix transcriptional regulator [Pseudovibrio flavus]MTI15813.1 LuxR family transcriptional regulator [Pseudovibrio flavus]